MQGKQNRAGQQAYGAKVEAEATKSNHREPNGRNGYAKQNLAGNLLAKQQPGEQGSKHDVEAGEKARDSGGRLLEPDGLSHITEPQGDAEQNASVDEVEVQLAHKLRADEKHYAGRDGETQCQKVEIWLAFDSVFHPDESETPRRGDGHQSDGSDRGFLHLTSLFALTA